MVLILLLKFTNDGIQGLSYVYKRVIVQHI